MVFTLPAGTPVLAARAGRVIDLDAKGVILLHSDGTYARYFDLVPDATLRPGQSLPAGAPVGAAGEAGEPIEFAVQRTLAESEGPKAEALPAAFFAYDPPLPLKLKPGEKVVADYTHAYVPPPPPEPKPAVERTPATLLVVRDIDRETVQRAYAAMFGHTTRASGPASPPWYAPAVRGWTLLVAAGSGAATAASTFLRNPPQLGPLAAIEAGLGVLAVGFILLFPVTRRLRTPALS